MICYYETDSEVRSADNIVEAEARFKRWSSKSGDGGHTPSQRQIHRLVRNIIAYTYTTRLYKYYIQG